MALAAPMPAEAQAAEVPRPVPYSIAVSQWAYSGSRPRTASK